MSKKGDNIEVPDFGGIVTPYQVLKHATDTHEDFECVVLIGYYKDGDIKFSHSGGSFLQKVGMAQCASDYFLLRIREE